MVRYEKKMYEPLIYSRFIRVSSRIVTLSNCYQELHHNNINDIASLEFIRMILPMLCSAKGHFRHETENL